MGDGATDGIGVFVTADTIHKLSTAIGGTYRYVDVRKFDGDGGRR